jgi:glycosyltransferase involved in cell wall biosynthesis
VNRRPIEILILTFTYPPNKDGVAEASRAMAEGLAARGFKVTVATTFLPERDTENGNAGVAVRHFKVNGRSEMGIGFSGEVESFLDFVKSFRGDVIISHCWDVWTTDLARKCFAQLSAKKILVSHGFSTQVPPWNPKFPWGLGVWLRWQPYVWRLPWMLRAYDHVTFLSEFRNFDRYFDHLVAHWTCYQRTSVIPNSANLPPIDPIVDFRKKHGLENELIFLCVANYCARKNQEMALRAFRRSSINGGALVFIGSEFNEYAYRLQRLDRDLANGVTQKSVLLLEKVSRTETAAAFHACDVFVLSAKIETQPIVLLEAMACAKPFISTDTGSSRELSGGRIVNSVEDLGREMERLVADPVERRQMGERGHSAYLARYTPERVLDAYENLIRTLSSPSLRADTEP